MGIYGYLFPMCLLRKTIFYYSSMLYYDSLKGFRLCIVDTRRRNILLLKNTPELLHNINYKRGGFISNEI